MIDFDSGFLEDPDFAALILGSKIRFKVKKRDIRRASRSSTRNPITLALIRKTGIEDIIVNGNHAVIGGSYYALGRRAKSLFWRYETGRTIKPERLKIKLKPQVTFLSDDSQ